MFEDRNSRRGAQGGRQGHNAGEQARELASTAGEAAIGLGELFSKTWVGPITLLAALIGVGVAGYSYWSGTDQGSAQIAASEARQAEYEALRQAQAPDGLPAPMIAHETGVRNLYLLIDAKTGCHWYATGQSGHVSGFTGMEPRTERLADGSDRQICNPPAMEPAL